MEIKSEHHKTQKTLFRRINQIKRANGLYRFDVEKTGYKLQYCDSENIDNMYVVLKGKDGLPFKLHDGQEGYTINVNTGDVLVYECESNNKLWFSYAKWLTETDLNDAEQNIGYTTYGTIPEMIHDGLITKLQNINGLSLETVTEKCDIVIETIEETQPKYDKVRESCDGVTGVFDALERLLKDINLKDVLYDIEHISGYTTQQTIDRIQTHKVMRRPGARLSNTLPQLRFGGRWIKRAGFTVGQEIKVITINGMILIVPMHSPEIPNDNESEYQEPLLEE